MGAGSGGLERGVPCEYLGGALQLLWLIAFNLHLMTLLLESPWSGPGQFFLCFQSGFVFLCAWFRYVLCLVYEIVEVT